MSDVVESDRLPGLPHPRERTSLIGHGQAEAELLQALSSNKLAHGWIFAGPEGIGKATLAYRFAKYLLCHPEARSEGAVNTLDVDPAHPVFQQIVAQAHPDLFVLRRSWDQKTKRLRTELRAEEVREANHFFARTSGSGGYRVCIIDTADDMNRTAANALLKVLEEPPERSLFLLISNMPGRLLTTIRSRCRVLRLAPLDENDTLAGLRELGGGDADEKELAACARIAGGSIGRCLTLLRGDGLKLYDQMMKLLSAMPQLDRGQLLKVAADLGAPRARADYKLFCGLLSEWLARTVKAAATGQVERMVQSEIDLANRLGIANNAHDWAERWQDIAEAMRRAEIYNLDRRQVMVNAFVDLERAARTSIAHGT